MTLECYEISAGEVEVRAGEDTLPFSVCALLFPCEIRAGEELLPLSTTLHSPVPRGTVLRDVTFQLFYGA